MLIKVSPVKKFLLRKPLYSSIMQNIAGWLEKAKLLVIGVFIFEHPLAIPRGGGSVGRL